MFGKIMQQTWLVSVVGQNAFVGWCLGEVSKSGIIDMISNLWCIFSIQFLLVLFPCDLGTGCHVSALTH